MTSADPIRVVYMTESEKNPYTRLLRTHLDSIEDVSVVDGVTTLLFPFIRSVSESNGDVLQLDWVSSYYMVDDYSGSNIVDTFLTIMRAILFMIDISLVTLSQSSLCWTVHNKHHHELKYPRVERVINEFLFYVSDSISIKCTEAGKELTDEYQFASLIDMTVIPDGNFISVYDNTVSTSEAREHLSIEKGKFVYLYFGVIREYKGVPDLIKAFENLEYNDIELWIVGDPYTESIEESIRSLANNSMKTHLKLEFIPENKVQYYLNAADVLVLPYRDILNSGSVHLGLSFGLPIVAPRMGCIPHTVPYENEFLYDTSQQSALLHELKHSYRHSGLNSIGESNYEKAAKQNWEKSAASFASIYRSIT